MVKTGHRERVEPADGFRTTSVHGFCSDCGAVEVPLSALAVELDADDRHNGSYCYTCPSCAGLVREHAGHRLAEVLVAFGAPVAGRPNGDARLQAYDEPARMHFFAA